MIALTLFPNHNHNLNAYRVTRNPYFMANVNANPNPNLNPPYDNPNTITVAPLTTSHLSSASVGPRVVRHPALTLLMYVRQWHWSCRRDKIGGGAEGECDVAHAPSQLYVSPVNVWLVVNGPLQGRVKAGGEVTRCCRGECVCVCVCRCIRAK